MRPGSSQEGSCSTHWTTLYCRSGPRSQATYSSLTAALPKIRVGTRVGGGSASHECLLDHDQSDGPGQLRNRGCLDSIVLSYAPRTMEDETIGWPPWGPMAYTSSPSVRGKRSAGRMECSWSAQKELPIGSSEKEPSSREPPISLWAYAAYAPPLIRRQWDESNRTDQPFASA